MNKVTIGLLVGLVLGLAVGAYMSTSTANEFAVLSTCIGTGLAGVAALQSGFARIEAKSAFLFIGAMATDATGFEERLHFVSEMVVGIALLRYG